MTFITCCHKLFSLVKNYMLCHCINPALQSVKLLHFFSRNLFRNIQDDQTKSFNSKKHAGPELIADIYLTTYKQYGSPCICVKNCFRK